MSVLLNLLWVWNLFQNANCQSCFRFLSTESVPLVEFMYLVFTRMPDESYRRQLRSLLLYLCYVIRALINSLVLILHERSGPRSVSDFWIQNKTFKIGNGASACSFIMTDTSCIKMSFWGKLYSTERSMRLK